MRTGVASVRNAGALDPSDRAVKRFLERPAPQAGLSHIAEYWDGLADRSVTLLAALVKADLQRRFERGETPPPTVGEYLDRFPDLRAQGDRVLSLVYEEFCLRESAGQRPDTEEFCDRYAAWRDSLVSQLRYHRAISRVVGAGQERPPFPKKGEYFEEFLILDELGRGGAGRVYLARDVSMGDRVVALKVSPDRGDEPSILARLSHPNIVEVYSVSFDTETGLRGLCMPYRPGFSLDELNRRLNPGPGGPGTPRVGAEALWQALVGRPSPPAPPAEGPASVPPRAAPPAKGPGWAGFPAGGTFDDAVAWVGAALARALHYAHAQGVEHRDVKPGNILVTFERGPQLLDFNLAHDPNSAAQAEAAMLGGTLPYMAPEQLEAFLLPDLWAAVGPRADVYALGLVLRELLTGEAPDAPDPTQLLPDAIRGLLARRAAAGCDLRSARAAVPFALEAIVARCLATDPARRYRDAEALAEDLERFLARAPLRHVRNPSKRERVSHWTERNGRRLAAAATAVVVLSVLWTGYAMTADRRVSAPPGPQDDPGFLAAVREIDAGQPALALKGFAAADRAFPDSSVVGLYHAVSLDAVGRAEDAEAAFGRVTDRPSLEGSFNAWSANHPHFAEHAESLGDHILARAGDDPDRRKLAGRAYFLALGMNENRREARFGRIFKAEHGKVYRAAEADLTRLVLAGGGPALDPKSAPKWLFDAVYARARVLTALGQAAEKAPALIKNLTAAEQDLSRAMDDLAAAKAFAAVRPGDAARGYDMDFVACENRLALTGVLERLNSRRKAGQAHREAGAFLAKLQPGESDRPSYLDLAARVRAPRGGRGEVAPQPARPVR